MAAGLRGNFSSPNGPRNSMRRGRVDPINRMTETPVNPFGLQASPPKPIASDHLPSLLQKKNHRRSPMAPRIGKEYDFPKSKCNAAKLKQMYENRLLSRCLSFGYRLGGDVPAPRQGEIMIFASLFLAGLVPPFFEFFTTVVSFYDICHLHLNPNSIIMLSVFAQMCENFIGIEPCLDLFWFFYTVRLQTGSATGSCGFRLRDGVMSSYLEMNLKLSWLGWRDEWFYLMTDDSLDNFCVLDASACLVESWGSSPTLTAELLSLAGGVKALVEGGLSGSDVVRDFIKRRLCPLAESTFSIPVHWE
ncbi:uncharacterized protein LOC133923794 [Phragmites australis]|uniref:uncharacterized protein LOC133923794 n=1 Tax=Phragmites australis TaxID=29695 RepID=UPI002D785F81|nr:uncharacterized protein LOC133923792 isoform X1 [Phragmites australis]XP_062225036.1 uncharacterized protein LOC133923794 [Phragmites australis]